jgi:hypothetical protein
MIEKVCPVCNSTYRVSPSHSKQGFCSQACRSKTTRTERVCKHCGVGFTVPNSLLKVKGAGQYCSAKCVDESKIDPSKPGSKYREKQKPVGKVKINCVVCHKDFEVYPSRANTAKTCSNECGHKQRALARTKEKVELTCEKCGNVFSEHGSHAGRRRFCSWECKESSQAFRDEKSERYEGDKNPMWKGGVVEHSDGYIYHYAKDHPRSSNGYVFQHRLVIESAMREQAPNHPFMVSINDEKYLHPEIQVHHIDHDRKNNRITNLMAITQSAHMSLHGSGKAPEPWEFWKPTL